MPPRLRKILRLIWISAGVLFLLWNWWTFQARGLPKNTFESDSNVSVITSDDMITFKSNKSVSDFEIIFFQGGLTDPEAYGPLCKSIAEAGFTVHLIKMAWRLPQKDYLKIKDLFDLNRGDYILGGHSQGAKMAAQFVYENPDLMKGLILLATSHPRDIDLSAMDIPSVKIYAEHDGLASVAEVESNVKRLPQNCELIMIEGANHSQFGYLGQLLMDNAPSISLEEQQRKTTTHLLKFLKRFEKSNSVNDTTASDPER